ncbi:MAG TPA: hypothetical protein VGN00_14040 [Puia sp.]|jgi:hypothetical protein
MEKSPSFCGGCGTNWAALLTADEEEEDESYQYCPLCRTDAHLEPVHPGPLFRFNPITGETLDEHGAPKIYPISDAPPIPSWFGSFDEMRYISEKSSREEKENEALAAYHAALPNGEGAAKYAYRTSLIKNR